MNMTDNELCLRGFTVLVEALNIPKPRGLYRSRIKYDGQIVNAYN